MPSLLPTRLVRARRAAQRQRRVLLTGAGGQVASMLLPRWNDALGDLAPAPRQTDLHGMGTDRADLCLIEDCRRVLAGADAIVHLAGHSKDAPLALLWPPNVLALDNLLRCAAEAKVTHFVFASSMHVMGLYERTAALDESMPPRPDSHYATSKLHGEALCRLYGERHRMAVTCLRLGAVGEQIQDVEPGSWISPEDVLAMIRIALAADPPWFEIFHAVADASGSPLAPSRATVHGYRCSRPGEAYADSLARAARWWPRDEIARTRRGASFASEALS